eukprot:TRINITY_DN4322_c0_g1_i1.p1 TRINITY_DN4322_c0_g1~~TRINITY_DN4322_c0_g1_i1.p1  ORF type:complete len:510 (-),score=137.35 TRINITY_DN4322_c0_g1_i1:72-1517(-)
MTADIGVIGLAVMGENLVLNFESKGYTVAVNNRTVSKIDDFLNGRGKGKKIVGAHTLEEFVKQLKSPKRILMMVRAGDVVDHYIEQLTPLVSKGDIIIDGGNSHYPDTERRTKALEAKGILYLGCGVSGGEEGALNGPSIMPGGSPAAWPHVKEMLQAISAKVEDGTPCCDWVGEGGAGHFVKMVHNGIEYGDMQLIAESYHLMKTLLNYDNEKLASVYEEWNKGKLDSYLIEITYQILRKKDEDGTYIVDHILDKTGQKGTGKWTAQVALELGVPVTLIGEAVFSRCLSSFKEQRVAASKILSGPTPSYSGNEQELLDAIRDALYASKLVSYAQGFELMKAAAAEFKWKLNYGGVALMWRGGCIIRSKFLGKIKEAFDTNSELDNLLLDPFFTNVVQESQSGWRKVSSLAVLNGIPVPALTTALAYFDGYRTARLPANLTQAQRDFFGAHTYERLDTPNKWFHTNWTGTGGSTHSSTYNV